MFSAISSPSDIFHKLTNWLVSGSGLRVFWGVGKGWQRATDGMLLYILWAPALPLAALSVVQRGQDGDVSLGDTLG